MDHSAHLEDRSVLALSGPEASGFLQGLITNDVDKLREGSGMYAALLTPQGKVLFDFLVLRSKDGFLLDCHAEHADALLKRLLLYRLRTKVELGRRTDLAVIAGWPGASLPVAGWDDPRLHALGRRAIVAGQDLTAGSAGAASYRLHRLELGVPEGPDFGQDRLFALDADLQDLNGISFEKGCYVGQELSARMKHRGTARKRVFPILAMGGGAVVQDASVTAGAREIGTVISTYGSRGFALLRLDRMPEAMTAVEVAGTSVQIVRPSWLSA